MSKRNINHEKHEKVATGNFRDIRAFRGYKRYKSSGVEWLGDVPEHWEVKRLKYQVSINDETLPETTNPECEIIYVDISSVDKTKGIIQKEKMLFENAPSRARRIVKDGDTIVSTVRTYLRAIAPVIQPEDNLIVSTGFAVIRPRKIDKYFLSAVIRAPYFIEEVVSRSVGVSYPAINASEIGFISVPIPPLPEQQAIAVFLDRETERIDALIAKKQRLLELLAEQRTALISRAVTKGLDASVKLKPSGVEWLGDVPEHWKVLSLRYLFYIKAGGDLKEEFYSEERTDLYKYPIYTNSIKSDEVYGFTNKAFFRANSITVTGRGEIGYAVYRDQEFDAIIRLLVLTPKDSNPCKYYSYFINTMLEFFGGSTAVSQLSTEQISPYKVFCPPLPEQQVIAAFLDRETARIDTLSAKVTTVIEKLKEYRTALISSAVTGKIDVTSTLKTSVRETV